jgi:hypothetical protein
MNKLCRWWVISALVAGALGCSAEDPNQGPTGASNGSGGSTTAGSSEGFDSGLGSGGTGTGGGTGSVAPPSGSGGTSSSGAPTRGDSGEAAGAGAASGNGTVQPGTLTAGVWDDNRNFDFFLAYRKGMYKTQAPALPPFSLAEVEEAYDRFSQTPGPKQTLDISLVIDTTGSMADEIAYLQAEFVALSDAIYERYPNAEQRWSLVLYRDDGDEYLTQKQDFVSDKLEFQDTLSAVYAGGGGDTPEAPDEGLAEAATLGWREAEKTAKLAFWIADAPHHVENAGKFADAVRSLVDLGVHLYPVASSGVDELTEISMRSAAQLSGGRYIFLTDDSGVGGAHKEPTIPCYFVTKLDDAILRMVDIELSGVYREPEEAEIIRTGGEPLEGVCQLDEDRSVFVY